MARSVPPTSPAPQPVALTDEELHFIEDIAVTMESEALPRIAGKVVGLLLLAVPEHRSLKELREELGASMGSVSTMTRLLQQLGFIERVSVPGDKQARYRLRPHVWAARAQGNVQKAVDFRQFAERGLALLAQEPDDAKERLRALHASSLFWEREVPAVAQELHRIRSERLGEEPPPPPPPPPEPPEAPLPPKRRSKAQREADERQFVEDSGIIYEQYGMPRMAGRIIGRLLVCRPTHQTLPDLAEHLGASMGSVSTMTRFLEQIGIVERMGLPGERKVLFRLRNEAWSGLMDRQTEFVHSLRLLGDRGLALPETDKHPSRRERLLEMREVGQFYEERFPQMRTRFLELASRT